MISNLYKDIPETLSVELFQEILKRSNIRIERIVSRGHRSSKDFWYDQKWDEWILLVNGGAGLAFDDDDAVTELKPGDHLLIPAHKRHRVAWTADDEDTIWLAVHIYKT
jgi:cupin 2 domain-containing protein